MSSAIKFDIVAKEQSYDSDSQTVNLSINSITLTIRFENLKKWVQKMEKMCGDDKYCDSSDDEDYGE